MGADASNKEIRRSYWFRFVDIRQPEVKWALLAAILLQAFFVCLKLNSNFLLYEEVSCDILQGLISGIIGLIGVAVAGVAIVITLFSPSQVKIIENLSPGAFGEILRDFKWLALLSAFETGLFILTIFIIRTPLPVAPPLVFYLFSFLLAYSIFYLLFYGYALISNCIKLSHIKNWRYQSLWRAQ